MATVKISEISRFRWLIVWMADELVLEDVQKARTLLKVCDKYLFL